MISFKAMTWNVENLFRPQIGAPQEDVEIYGHKLALLAGVINQQSPDVLGLQEIGGEEPLLDLQQALGGTYPNRIVSAFPDGRGIRVAFLTKHEVSMVEDIADFPPGPATQIYNLNAQGMPVPLNRMGRGGLLIRIEVDDLSIYVITAHLKSKLLTFHRAGGGSSFSPQNETERAQVAGIALHRRAAEAVTLRQRVNLLLENQSGQPLVLMGDLNDIPDAQTSLLLTGPTGSEIGTLGFNRPDKGDDARLFNLAPLISEDRRYSRIHHGRKELLDQIFASEELFPLDAEGDRTLPFVDSIVNYADELPSIGDNPNLRVDKIPPDHAPVVAAFTL